MPYFYDVPGFTLMIARRNDFEWVLSINDMYVKSYVSPYQAAGDAATQDTGDEKYDASPIAAPADLREWTAR